MSVLKQAFCVLTVLALTACAHSKKVARNPSDPMTPVGVDDAPRAQLRETEEPSEVIEEKSAGYKSPLGEIPMDYNKHVEKWLRYFQGRGRGHMERYLSRSGRYIPMMKNALREAGLPEDLVYVALIESGFTSKAHSHANAVGYWQFIKSTGRRYGLNVDPFIDERRDPVLSTRAASEYFKSLYSLFGSWHLSMAAYNVGENRVKRAVMKYSTRDFWELISKRRSFPVETKNYVPKFIAAAMIAKDPEKYGFTSIEYADPLSYDIITLQNPISMTKLAGNLGVDVEELRLLNPKFRGDFVPLSRNGETVVRIPVGMAADAQAAASVSVSIQPKVVESEYYFYRVRRGDTLSTIARRHRTTVSQLRRRNNLSNRALLRVGMKLLVNDNGGAAKYEMAGAEKSGSGVTQTLMTTPAREAEFHVVRRGDNISSIARYYGVAVSDVLRWNNLSGGGLIRVGQRLRVREPDESKSAGRESQGRAGLLKEGKRARATGEFKSTGGRKSSVLASSAVKMARKSLKSTEPSSSQGARHLAGEVQERSQAERSHRVRRGETLAAVSRLYGVPLYRLAKANGVSVNYRVLAGESLAIPR